MKIFEVFLGIQGEADEVGLPTIFVRFIGCNLRCSYCDTKYAYKGGKHITVPKLFKLIRKTAGPYRQVCLTGGEPLMQNPESIKKLLFKLHEEGYTVTIETNGSVYLKQFEDLRRFNIKGDFVNFGFVMDWKLFSSGQEDKMNGNNMIILDPNSDQVKFVVGDVLDFGRALTVIKNSNWHGRSIFSPVYKKLDPKKLVKWVLDAKVRNVRVQVQLHKIIFGPRKRGV